MRIVAPTYFPTPNDLVDYWLPLLKEGELRILLVLIRKTFGWHKSRDRISLSQFEKITGMTRSAVCNSIQSLVQKGIILKETFGKNGTQESYYELIVDDDSNNSDQYQKSTPPSSPNNPPPVFDKDSQKKLLNKDTKEKIVCSESPVGDPPLKKHESKFCEKTHIDGHKIEVSLQDLIGQSIKKNKNFTLDEIQEAWDYLLKCTQKIRDPLRYFEGIIEKIRNSKTYNKITKKEQEKKCQTKLSNHMKNNELNKKEIPIIDNRVSLGLDMLGRVLVK